jgi:hypothetical protein
MSKPISTTHELLFAAASLLEKHGYPAAGVAYAKKVIPDVPLYGEGMNHLDQEPLDLDAALTLLRECREENARLREATIEECIGECIHRAFLCHTHDECGKGREKGMLDCVKYLRDLKGKA